MAIEKKPSKKNVSCFGCKKEKCECKKPCETTESCCDCKKSKCECKPCETTESCCDCKKSKCECNKPCETTESCCDCKKLKCECKPCETTESCCDCKQEKCICQSNKSSCQKCYKDDCICEPPCDIMLPFIQKGKLPNFSKGSGDIVITLTTGILLDSILSIQLWIYTDSNNWVTQNDINYPFSLRIFIDGTLNLILPNNTWIIPKSPYRLVIQMATKFIVNETE